MNDWQKKKRKEEYTNYIMSPAWQHLRFEVFRRDGYICQMCHQNQASQVHHKTYARFGHEDLSDLVAVCDPCHKKHHKKVGNR